MAGGTLYAFAPRAQKEAGELWRRVYAQEGERWALLTDLPYWEWIREARPTRSPRGRSRRTEAARPSTHDIIEVLRSRLGGREVRADPRPPVHGPAVLVVFEGALSRLPGALRHPPGGPLRWGRRGPSGSGGSNAMAAAPRPRRQSGGV